jgi:protein CMS1
VREKCTIVKLFAKHIKIAEQKAFLASHRAPIAIGTPARIYKLALEEDKPISLDLVEQIIIDTHRDGKDRTVFDVPEIRKELIELLCKTPLLERLSTGATKIYLF